MTRRQQQDIIYLIGMLALITLISHYVGFFEIPHHSITNECSLSYNETETHQTYLENLNFREVYCFKNGRFISKINNEEILCSYECVTLDKLGYNTKDEIILSINSTELEEWKYKLAHPPKDEIPTLPKKPMSRLDKIIVGFCAILIVVASNLLYRLNIAKKLYSQMSHGLINLEKENPNIDYSSVRNWIPEPNSIAIRMWIPISRYREEYKKRIEELPINK